jgi:hypothetical protein
MEVKGTDPGAEAMAGHAVSDEALTRALGVYAGMVSQILSNPRAAGWDPTKTHP